MEWRRLGSRLGLGLGLGLCLVMAPEAEGGGRRKQRVGMEEAQVVAAFRKLETAESLIYQGRLPEALKLVDEAQADFEAAGIQVGVGVAQMLRGTILYSYSNYRRAVPELDAAIHTLCGVQNLEPFCAQSHLRRGQVAYGLGEASAMTHLNEALGLYRQLKDPQGEANARRSIGDVLLIQGSLQEAHKEYERTLFLYQDVGDRLGEANARVSNGDVLRLQGSLTMARKEYERALALYQAVGSTQGQANARLSVGHVLLLQGTLEEARREFEQALALYQASGDRLGEASARRGIGDVLRSQGSLEVARKEHEQALALVQAVGSPGGEAHTRLAIGQVLLLQGSVADGRREFEQALALYQAVGSPQGEANARLRIGEMLLRYQGSLEEARKEYELALALYLAVGDPQGEANARRSIGEVLRIQGSPEEARREYDQALTLYRTMGDRDGEADARRGIGEMLFIQGYFEEARKEYEQALALYQAMGDRQGEAKAWFCIGEVLRRQGYLEEARSAYDQTLSLCQSVGDPAGRLNALLGLARSHGTADADAKDRAWEYAQGAFALLRDEVQPQLGGQAALRRFSEENGDILTDLIRLGIELKHPEEALNTHLLFQGRGMLWARALTLRTQQGSLSPDVEALVDRYTSTQAAVGLSLSKLMVRGDSETLTALRTARREQEILEDQLGAQLGLTPQHFAPPTTAELQAALRQDPSHPVLAVYLQRDTELMVFVLDGEMLTVHRILGDGVEGPEQSALVQTTTALVESLHAPGLAPNTNEQRSALSGFELASAHTLYKALVDPWVKALDCNPGPCRPLLIVPDGLTHWVPFAALPTALPSDADPNQMLPAILSAPYLGRSVPITLLPTPALLLPRFQSTHPVAGAAVMGTPANADFIAAEQQEVVGVWAQLQPEACRSQGARCPKAPMTGLDAAEHSLLTWMPLVRYLHISSHGAAGWVRVTDLGYPYDEPISRLVLAEAPKHIAPGVQKSETKGVTVKGLPFKTGPEAGLPLGTPDGYLYKEEVQHFGSMPEMIVLSSCSSALGEYNRTEGFAGVTYGLLAAGSSGVISAAWPVRVEATRDQMLALYDAHFEDGQDWARALMSSRRAVTGELEGMLLDHPYFWAGFNLYGYVPPER